MLKPPRLVPLILLLSLPGPIGCGGPPGFPETEVPSAYFTDALYNLGWIETVAPPLSSSSGVLTTWWIHYDYATGYDGYGVITWDLFTGEELGSSERIPPESGASVEGPPVMATIADDGFILHAGNRSLTARNEVGMMWWRVALGGLATSSVATASDGTVLVGDDGGVLHAYSPDGNPRWAAALPGVPYGHPAIARDGSIWLFVKRSDSTWRLAQVSPAGTVMRDVESEIPVGSPAIDQEDRLLLPLYRGPLDANPPKPEDFFLRALTPEGRLDWEAPTDGSPYSPVVAPDGRIVVSAQASGQGGHLLSLNPRDGSQDWRVDLPGDVWQPAILERDVLVVGCGGDLCGFNLNNGKELFDWPADVGASAVMGPPLAQDGIVVANTNYGYFAWEIGSGLETEDEGWARLGADNLMTGRAK